MALYLRIVKSSNDLQIELGHNQSQYWNPFPDVELLLSILFDYHTQEDSRHRFAGRCGDCGGALVGQTAEADGGAAHRAFKTGIPVDQIGRPLVAADRNPMGSFRQGPCHLPAGDLRCIQQLLRHSRPVDSA